MVQSNTGRLFRIEIETRDVTEIDLGGASVSGGDGLVLSGRTLYVVRGALTRIDELALSEDYDRGELVRVITDPSLNVPTTAALADGRLLVVNSQFAARSGAVPLVLPFTVSALPLP